MSGIKYFFSYSIFVAICAVALSVQSCQLMTCAFDIWILIFVFFSVLLSYNLYSLVGIVMQAPQNIKKIVTDFPFKVGLIFSSMFVVMGILFVKPTLLIYFSIASGLTILYFFTLFSVKNMGIMKIILLPLVWTFVTVPLPLINSQLKPFSLLILFALRFIFLFMIAIIFDLRDRQRDLLNKRKTMATLFNNKQLIQILVVLFFCYESVLMLGASVIRNPQQLVIIGLTGFFTLAVFLISLRPRGYYFYYFLSDGLMLFSSIATFMVTI